MEQWARRPLKDLESLTEAAERLRETMALRALLVTRGKDGALLVEEGARPLSIGAVGSHAAVGGAGAGDTVMASGGSFEEAARLANHAGGIVVLKRGTASVRAEELLASIEHEGDASGPVRS